MLWKALKLTNKLYEKVHWNRLPQKRQYGGSIAGKSTWEINSDKFETEFNHKTGLQSLWEEMVIFLEYGKRIAPFFNIHPIKWLIIVICSELEKDI